MWSDVLDRLDDFPGNAPNRPTNGPLFINIPPRRLNLVHSFTWHVIDILDGDTAEVHPRLY